MLKKRAGSSRALKGLSDTIERLRGAASHECDSGKQEGEGAGLRPEIRTLAFALPFPSQ